MTEPLVQVERLEVHFPVYSTGVIRRQSGTVRAVDGVTFSINRGETLGLVGESGCGKTTTGLAVLRLIEPTGGTVTFDGVDVDSLSKGDLRRLRKRVAMIFQDPYASLDPRMSIGEIIAEPLAIHGLYPGKRNRTQRIAELLDMVGLNPDYRDRFPHEFSGGQRQRVGIARALATEPDFIVCDEPIAALDVSIQAQVMNLLEDLQDELNLTYLFIAHDLSAVQHLSDRVAVMYLGRIAEIAEREQVTAGMKHPYSESLLSAVPIPNPALERNRTRILLKGDVPSPLNPPSGCRFRTRCRYAMDRCAGEEPPLLTLDTGHVVACYLYDPGE
jgi:oligopeptide transport system ATP-binding protein